MHFILIIIKFVRKYIMKGENNERKKERNFLLRKKRRYMSNCKVILPIKIFFYFRKAPLHLKTGFAINILIN